MAQQSSSPNHSSANPEHNHDLSPRQPARHPAAGRNAINTRAIGQVAVLEVAGPLGDLVEDLDQAIQVALAEGPRGVVCDLSTAPEDAQPGAVEWLATAGRHVRHWPGIPVAVACPNPRVREALRNHPLGRHLIVTASVAPVLSAVLATPIPDIDCLTLTPHPTAPRASRDFVARALLGWGLGPLVLAASLVVSELVTNSTIHAGTDIELSVAWNLGLLRLTVRDNSPDLPRPQYPTFVDVHGRGLSVIAALSRALGVLPTAEGGKLVWAVLNAARPKPSNINGMHRIEPVLDKKLAIHDAVCDGVIKEPTWIFAPGVGAGAVAGYAVMRIDPAVVAISTQRAVGNGAHSSAIAQTPGSRLPTAPCWSSGGPGIGVS
jgi:hypothetical protein